MLEEETKSRGELEDEKTSRRNAGRGEETGRREEKKTQLEN